MNIAGTIPQRSATPAIFRQLLVLLALCLLVTGCTAIVYSTGGAGGGYTYIMLLPILLGAVTYDIWGGVAVATAGGLLLGPYMPLYADVPSDQSPERWLIRIVMFALVGSVAGVMFNQLRRQAKAKLDAARTDIQTGLPNQVALNQDLEARLCEDDGGDRVGVILVRATDLADVAGVVGIQGTDQTMKALGRYLDGICPEIFRAYRFSGSELALVARTDDAGALERIARTVHASAGASFQVDGAPIRIEPVLGIGYAGNESDLTASELVRRARVALRRATVLERHWVTYEPSLDKHTSGL